MKKVSTLISTFDVLYLALHARLMLQQALVKVLAKCGGPQVLFMNANTLKDYTTDVEFMGHW